MERINESIEAMPPEKICDDGDNWIIRDVVLLSEFSKNKGPKGMPRRYPREEQEKALKLFENIHVNCNHPAKRADGSVDESSRNVLMKLGKVVAPRLVEGMSEGKRVSKVVGDVILVKGDASNHIVKLVRLDPKLAGMSITGNLDRFDTTEGYENVVGLKPESVDVVHRPATTLSMFESRDDAMAAIEEAFPFKKKPEDDKADDEEVPEGDDEEETLPDDEEELEGDEDEDGLDLGDGDDDEEVEDEDKDGFVDGEEPETEAMTDEPTDEANAATAEAAVKKTAECHMDASMAHATAAGYYWKCGNKARAMEHLNRCKEHEAAADRLSHLQKFPTRAPMPQQQDLEQKPVQAESLTLIDRIYS